MPSSSPFRVLVTGGTGYLGAALLRLLPRVRPDWEIHATFHSHPALPLKAHWHPLDLRNASLVQETLEQIDPALVLHTAAQMTGALGDLLLVNTTGSRAVASAAASTGARLLHLSTDLVFDGTKGHYRETDAPNPILPYGESRWRAEQEVLREAPGSAIVRTSLIYGLDPVDPRTAAILSGAMPRLFTDEIRSPVQVDDLCLALLELAETDYRGLLHIAGPQPLSRYDFGCKLVRALGGDDRSLIPARSADSGLVRPLDCTLDISRTQGLLRTPLLGVDEILRKNAAR